MSPFLPLLPIINNSLIPRWPRSASRILLVNLLWPYTCATLSTWSFPKWAILKRPTLTHNLSFVSIFSFSIEYLLSDVLLPILFRKQFQHICQHSLGSLGLISTLFASLNSRSSLTSFSYVTQWDRDLASEIDLADWSKTWSSVNKCSFNTATLEAAYKVFLRWYWVPAKIAHTNPTLVTTVFGDVVIVEMLSTPGGHVRDCQTFDLECSAYCIPCST